jgi:cytochrome P450
MSHPSANVGPSATAGSRPLIPQGIAAHLADPSAHADHRLTESLTWLRANMPLGIAQVGNFDPFWVVTRQKELRSIALRNDLFHNGDRPIVLVERDHEAHMRALFEGRNFPARTVLQMDAPEHSSYRAVAAEIFFPRGVNRLEPQIRQIAREFVHTLRETGGSCDFAREIAFLYPLRVIMQIIGIPPQDEPLMLRLTHEYFGIADPDQAREGNAARGAAAADVFTKTFAEFFAYFDQLLAARRRQPADDLATAIANARIDGALMPQHEARSYCFVAATAGHDTTAAVTAGCMQALCEFPDQFRRVKEDRSLISSMIEEATRWVSPSKITMRSAAADVEFCDRSFRRGDWIAMAWASGNRDEQVFDDPFSFRVDRKPNRLISFGHGPHVCLGQHLGRLEMRVLFEELIEQLEHVELTATPTNLASLFASGPKTVPIRFRIR